VESSDDDLDQDDLDLPKVQDIQRIWDDDRMGGQDDDDPDDMENFIDYDEDEDDGVANEEEREEKRRERRKLEKERRRAMGSRPGLVGMDARQVASYLWKYRLDLMPRTCQRLGRNLRCIRRRPRV
jgi:transcription elongation factor SPT6